MRRIEMLDQDEGHPGLRRQCADEFPAGIEAPRRGANADEREIRRQIFMPSGNRRTACRCWPGRLVLCHLGSTSGALAARRIFEVAWFCCRGDIAFAPPSWLWPEVDFESVPNICLSSTTPLRGGPTQREIP